MARVIAFEGPDLTGKSSLLAALRKRMPYSMWPLFKIELTNDMLGDQDRLDTAVRAFYEGLVVAARTVPFLMDRCYVSSWVYGTEAGRTNVDVSWIRSTARRLDPIIVYVKTPTAVLIDRLKWRGDDYVTTRERLVRIDEIYRDWAIGNPFGDTIVVVGDESDTVEGTAEVLAKRLEDLR